MNGFFVQPSRPIDHAVGSVGQQKQVWTDTAQQQTVILENTEFSVI